MAIRSTQLPLGVRIRSRVGMVVAALALTLGVIILAAQASSTFTDPATVAPAESAREHAVNLPVFVHPGAHRGQVRFGSFDDVRPPVRPHGPNQRPKWGG